MQKYIGSAMDAKTPMCLRDIVNNAINLLFVDEPSQYGFVRRHNSYFDAMLFESPL